jgi:archaemetzincin
MAGRELQLVAVGNIKLTFCKELEEGTQQVLGVEVFTGKLALADARYAFNKDRNQYHSNAIMRRLLTVKEPGIHLVLGVADFDLFVPDTPFVFGESDRESHAGVFSTFRFKGEGDILKKRAQMEAVHQAGHLIGLSYCEDVRCLMFFATGLPEFDRRNFSLCNNCKNELHKLRRV